jgi:hypothetical protein
MFHLFWPTEVEAILIPIIWMRIVGHIYGLLQYTRRIKIVFMKGIRGDCMKLLFLIVALTSFSSCQKSSDSLPGRDDEITIERQEDFSREDVNPEETVPVEQDQEVDTTDD